MGLCLVGTSLVARPAADDRADVLGSEQVFEAAASAGGERP